MGKGTRASPCTIPPWDLVSYSSSCIKIYQDLNCVPMVSELTLQEIHTESWTTKSWTNILQTCIVTLPVRTGHPHAADYNLK